MWGISGLVLWNRTEEKGVEIYTKNRFLFLLQ
jgi:hypothetical protein